MRMMITVIKTTRSRNVNAQPMDTLAISTMFRTQDAVRRIIARRLLRTVGVASDQHDEATGWPDSE